MNLLMYYWVLEWVGGKFFRDGDEKYRVDFKGRIVKEVGIKWKKKKKILKNYYRKMCEMKRLYML